MRSVLYLIRRRPGPLANETTDLMLVSGVFEQLAEVLFLDDGVLQLRGIANRQSPLKALAAYGVKNLHADAESVARNGMTLDDVPFNVQPADARRVRELIAAHDVVIAD